AVELALAGVRRQPGVPGGALRRRPLSVRPGGAPAAARSRGAGSPGPGASLHRRPPRRRARIPRRACIARSVRRSRPARRPAAHGAGEPGPRTPRLRALTRAPPRADRGARLARCHEPEMRPRRWLVAAAVAFAGALETAWLTVSWLNHGHLPCAAVAKLD